MSKRFFVMALAILMVAAFSAGDLQAAKNVTFQVNMAIQIQAGNFVFGKNIVVARGDWQVKAGFKADWTGYAAHMTQGVSDSTFSLTVVFDDTMATKQIQFKFVISDSTVAGVNFGNDSSAPGPDNWESVSNRTYTLTSLTNQTIPVVYFNDINTLLVTHNVTFQATMDTLLAAGFNPATDSICIQGGFEGWSMSNTTKMTPKFGAPHTYQIQLPVKDAPGVVEQWKFRTAPFAKFDNDGWDNNPNNTFNFPSADTTLAPVLPNITVKNVISKDVAVTFHVDMNGAIERFHNSAITGLTGVYMGGTPACPPLAWPGSWTYGDTTTMVKLYDDGTHGDVTGGDNIWSTQVTFLTANIVSRNLVWKYAGVFSGVDTLNGGTIYLDNEAGNSVNHNATLDDVTGVQTISNKFGDQALSVREDKVAKVPVRYSLDQNYPNPFNPSTTIKYALPVSGSVTLKIYNIVGQEVASLFEGHQNAGSYVATFDATRLASGMYFYRLQSGNFVDVKKMLLLK